MIDDTARRTYNPNPFLFIHLIYTHIHTSTHIHTHTGATGVSLLCYLTLAQAAYYIYGNAIEYDVLTSFPSLGLVLTLRALMSLVVTFSYPLQAHPARACMLALWAELADIKKTEGGDGADGAGGADTHTHTPPPRHVLRMRYILLTLFFLAASFLVALVVEDLSLILEVYVYIYIYVCMYL